MEVVSRCHLCPGKNKCVLPDGPTKCDLLFIGEAPGSVENQTGKPFDGKTGEETNAGYLPILGRKRSNIRITNAIHCLPDTPQGKLKMDSDKHLALLESCANHHLYHEIIETEAKLIIPMGAFACHAIDPSINLELQHGRPTETPWGTVFPMYHPAGGIHEPKKMLLIRTDWVGLGRYLKGKMHLPFDPFEGSEDYREMIDPEDLDEVLEGREWNHLAMDTETKKNKDPFCVTLSAEPGTGYLIRADNWATLERLRYWFRRWRGVFVFHNWLFDGEIFRRMNLELNVKRVRDTMLMAFHLGNLPQGLKALSYRELGMAMQDFDDLVTPHAAPLVLDYYRQMHSESWGKPDEELVRDPSGKWKIYKPQGLNTKIKRFFTDWGKNPDKNVFAAWDNWKPMHEVVEEQLGQWPGKCISYAAKADWPTTLRYACRDADATGRLFPLLREMRRNVRKRPQEFWGRVIAA